MRVAVLGATGTIGRALVPELARRHEVVAIARRPGPDADGVTWRAADATDEDALREALEGVEVVHHLVHSLGSPDFEERDRRAAERLAAGSVPVTTLRAAMIVGRGSAAFETVRALVERLPGMICPRWVSTETQPIALADVVRYLAGVTGCEAAYGETYDLGGPEVMTYRTMIERIARLRGRRPLIIEVPILSPRLSSLWLHLVTPVRAGVARPLVEGLKNPTVARDTRIRELVPFEPTPFDAAAREAFEPDRS